ncbi:MULTISPECIES: tyrosine-protein phosphatase [Microbacterium]|uniref:Tyrosine-protein phosphatase n=2 Tax=Microbacterium maritypicum TaxID=33918 RepID=A0AAJ5SJW3_MICMQ|nr:MULTISPECIES: tyrosine-protein phosphatase [Microbacterium]EYT59629.1 protein tyrosine phosphatase [Microbacterium sp. UCD-TDU]MBP5801712.1 tyrosine-protein phosphatase [Microbacterium liquefaciens]UTT51634.1 tyrosine-protein phosphatase [Microbacterium liquefaciens]WEF19701.1 tyrosine-protein phosphatase [Microbacterium liquefaciens]
MTILEIEGVFNVRDVGGMPANGGRIRSGALLRAGQLSGATTSGAAALRARVQHIVDLRDGEEVAAEPSEIEGPDTTHLPLFLGSVRSFFEADTSLDDLYLHLLEESGERLADAIRIIAAGERTLVHCTVGKDRTGVTVALALSAVGADREAVIADYALTESQLPAQRSQRIADYLRTQHPEAVHAVALATQSPAPVMRRLLEQVDERWGSAAGYLRAQGMTEAELAALSAALVEDASESSTSPLPS